MMKNTIIAIILTAVSTSLLTGVVLTECVSENIPVSYVYPVLRNYPVSNNLLPATSNFILAAAGGKIGGDGNVSTDPLVPTDGTQDINAILHVNSIKSGNGTILIDSATSADTSITWREGGGSRFSLVYDESQEQWEFNRVDSGTQNVFQIHRTTGDILIGNNLEGTVDIEWALEIPVISKTTPSENVACAAAGDLGSVVYVSDTDDAAAGQHCICHTTDDETTFDWVTVGDLTAACTLI